MTADTLKDWGEFRLLSEMILPALKSSAVPMGLGDDCAYVRWPGGDSDTLVVTVDVGPTPLAWSLGHRSYRTWGWYVVLVNASDLASAGAEPLAFASSVEAPDEMPVDDLRDFFEGMADACRDMGIPNAGGNLRKAPRFASHGMALGTTHGSARLTRAGCRPGDRAVVVGECGLFAAACLKARSRGWAALTTEEERLLIRPRPRLREMQALRATQAVHAASDNSDGILGSLWNIAERSSCGFELDLREEIVPGAVRQAAAENGLDPWNLMLMWGDWQVVVAVPEDALDSFRRVAGKERIPLVEIGRAVEGPPRLSGLRDGSRRPMRLLRNENFRPLSYNAGASDHLDQMLRTPLFVE